MVIVFLQQYFNNNMSNCSIGGGNRSTQWKPM